MSEKEKQEQKQVVNKGQLQREGPVVEGGFSRLIIKEFNLGFIDPRRAKKCGGRKGDRRLVLVRRSESCLDEGRQAKTENEKGRTWKRGTVVLQNCREKNFHLLTKSERVEIGLYTKRTRTLQEREGEGM